jgi:hypothetical protein
MSGTQSQFNVDDNENRWSIKDAYKRALDASRKSGSKEFVSNRPLQVDNLHKEKSDNKTSPLIKLSDELYDILDEVRSPLGREIIELESSPLVHNGIKIEVVDVSKADWCFDVKIGDKVHNMKIGRFIRYYFGKTFPQREIFKFSEEYNNLKKGIEKGKGDDLSNFKSIDSNEYKEKQDPNNIKSTFISLVTQTYPHGHEEEVMHLLPSDLTKDEFGNYYKIIGKSTTMFTSHLDTADRNKSTTVLYEMEKNGETFITTDGTTILGADDKAGVAVMLYMMSNQIPGVYYFFIGEERGGIGSGKVANNFEGTPHIQGIKKCISFDRRNYHSVITSQLGKECCSDEFAMALSNELNKNGLDIKPDPTGIYTDSANFIDDIPECTNISVGYFSEHTDSEHQNITYLEKLAKASLNINWENLPIKRKVGVGEIVRKKYQGVFRDIRKSVFSSEVKLMADTFSDDKAYIRIGFEDTSISEAYNDMMVISQIMKKNNIDPDVYFLDQYVKIELK